MNNLPRTKAEAQDIPSPFKPTPLPEPPLRTIIVPKRRRNRLWLKLKEFWHDTRG